VARKLLLAVAALAVACGPTTPLVPAASGSTSPSSPDVPDGGSVGPADAGSGSGADAGTGSPTDGGASGGGATADGGSSGGGSAGGGSASGGSDGGTPTQFKLTIVISGSGAVRSTPAGLDCTAKCAATFLAGTTVALSATPARFWALAGFSGACNRAPCSIQMDGDLAVSITFLPAFSQLTVAFAGEEGGRIASTPAGIDCHSPGPCSHTFIAGTQISLQATPDVLASLSGYSGACTGTTCSFTIDGDAIVNARFEVQRYSVVALGTLPPDFHSEAFAISIDGSHATGESAPPTRPFYWNGALHDIGIASGWGTGVNDAGAVAGNVQLPSGDMHAFLWQGGAVHDLGTLAGATGSIANGINQAGVVVGSALLPPPGSLQAVSWDGDGVHDLGSLGGCSDAMAINSHGVVVGDSCLPGGAIHAARFRGAGIVDDLGTLGGAISRARGINDEGTIVGGSQIDASDVSHGFVWHDGSMIDAGALPAYPSVVLNAINSSGIAVGNAQDGRGGLRGVVHGGGRMRDLSQMLDAEGWQIQAAWGIDAAGDIAASGVNSAANVAVILRPK
jgi:probable HAF family extracellular repeat protein